MRDGETLGFGEKGKITWPLHRGKDVPIVRVFRICRRTKPIRRKSTTNASRPKGTLIDRPDGQVFAPVLTEVTVV